jgi:hypothetical protein
VTTYADTPTQPAPQEDWSFHPENIKTDHLSDKATMDPVRSMQNLMAILNQPNLLVRAHAIMNTCLKEVAAVPNDTLLKETHALITPPSCDPDPRPPRRLEHLHQRHPAGGVCGRVVEANWPLRAQSKPWVSDDNARHPDRRWCAA